MLTNNNCSFKFLKYYVQSLYAIRSITNVLSSACPQDIINNNYTFIHNIKIDECYKALYIIFTNIFHIFILLHIQYIRIFFCGKKFVFALSMVL